jgi:heme a synthase
VALPRMQPSTYRKVAMGALVMLSVIVVSGAAVRLTGSGLGCPDWPTCYENQFHAELEYHALIEYANRLFTGVVCVAVILAVLGSLIRQPRRRDLTLWSLGLVAGVIAQIIVGAMVVLLHLKPQAVMLHFGLSMILIWNATLLHVRAGEDSARRLPVTTTELRRLSRVVFGATCLAMFIGTVVTGSGPHAGDETVTRLDFHMPDVAQIHGISVWVLLATLMLWFWMARREQAPAGLQRAGRQLLVVLVAQGAIGYTQYFTGVPVQLVALHIVGATLAMVFVTRFVLAHRRAEASPADSELVEPALIAV